MPDLLSADCIQCMGIAHISVYIDRKYYKKSMKLSQAHYLQQCILLIFAFLWAFVLFYFGSIAKCQTCGSKIKLIFHFTPAHVSYYAAIDIKLHKIAC